MQLGTLPPSSITRKGFPGQYVLLTDIVRQCLRRMRSAKRDLIKCRPSVIFRLKILPSSILEDLSFDEHSSSQESSSAPLSPPVLSGHGIT